MKLNKNKKGKNDLSMSNKKKRRKMKELKVGVVFTILLAFCFMSFLSFSDRQDTEPESTTQIKQEPCISYLSAQDCKPKKAVYVDIWGRVGISTKKPLQKLHVNGDATINGSLGIGTANPKAKLDVNGAVAINGDSVIDNTGKWVGDPTGLTGPQGPQGPEGPQGPQGEQGPPGIGITNAYDSGWFAVSSTTTYTKNHNLGTDRVFISIYSATDSSGTGMMMEGGIMNGTTHYSGIQAYNITHSDVSIFVNNTFRFIANLPNHPHVTSGYARIIMIGLE